MIRLKADTLMETLVAGLIVMSVLLSGFAVFGQIGRQIASYGLYSQMRECRDSLVAALDGDLPSGTGVKKLERDWGTLSYGRIAGRTSTDTVEIFPVKVVCRLRTGRTFTMYYDMDVRDDEKED